MEKDVRSAERGRRTSITRLKEARKAGYTIPDLATAFRNVRVDEDDAEGAKTGKDAHDGQTGQVLTNEERAAKKKESRARAKEAWKAEDKAKRAKLQEDTTHTTS